jgi:glycosyltransferase involved in cell wall biosynthesis
VTPARTYRFGFVLSTAAGNLTRYLNLRKYAELDPEVECVWAPNPGDLDPDPFRPLSPALRKRLVAMRLARPALRQLSRLDAIMFHGFEPYAFTALRSLVARRPLLVWSRDDPPTADPRFWEHYGVLGRSTRRARLRWAIDAWCARRAALLFPFSRWAAEGLVAGCHVPREKVHLLHVGVDLQLWPHARVDAGGGGHPRILFVGGDFARKGGDLLLDVFERRFAGGAELHLVTNQPPPSLPARVFVHAGLVPNDPRLRPLYAEADLFVLPTRADFSPNVILEAMATGIPVIASRLCGIPDMVHDGETGFLVPPDDGAALAERIETLLRDPEMRRRMGVQGRALAEREFSAAVNVPRILALMKSAVDSALPWPRRSA